MITLITAVPGSGKNSFSGWFNSKNTIQKVVRFSIISVVCKLINSRVLSLRCSDWIPHGSVVYDASPTPIRAAVSDERLTAMETHRHSGHDLIFITQAPTFLHHHARKLVGQHIHLYRGGGSKVVARYEWSHVCDSPNDRREQERADFQTFHFNKSHFELYQSATIHTHKFKNS